MRGYRVQYDEEGDDATEGVRGGIREHGFVQTRNRCRQREIVFLVFVIGNQRIDGILDQGHALKIFDGGKRIAWISMPRS